MINVYNSPHQKELVVTAGTFLKEFSNGVKIVRLVKCFFVQLYGSSAMC
jgi:hypothetical protein